MILDAIVADKKIRVAASKEAISPAEMEKQAYACTRPVISFYQALAKNGFSLIGEFKRQSPSHGKMDNPLSLEERISQYNDSVDAISCLTEEDHFLGNIDYFRQIRDMSPLPMLRKDFIFDPYQIWEARTIGADAVLLIAAILSDEELKALYDLAYALGLDVLLEVHDETEMKRAIALGAKIIGINNRNLQDFSIDLHTTKKLAAMRPTGTVLISESGVSTEDDVKFLKGCGVDGLLAGTILMENAEPKALAHAWKTL